MKKRISKTLIKKGLKKGLINFRMEQDNLAAIIGDNWFYICSEPELTEDFFEEAELIDMIHIEVNGPAINSDKEEDATECLYYKYYLEETLAAKPVEDAIYYICGYDKKEHQHHILGTAVSHSRAVELGQALALYQSKKKNICSRNIENPAPFDWFAIKDGTGHIWNILKPGEDDA